MQIWVIICYNAKLDKKGIKNMAELMRDPEMFSRRGEGVRGISILSVEIGVIRGLFSIILL